MHITIVALGSSGDVLPYATLGKALHVAGHEVRLAALKNFASIATTRDLVFHPVRGDMAAIMNTQGGIALAEAGSDAIRMWIGILRSVGPMAQSFAKDLYALAQYPTDLILAQTPGALYAYDLAGKLDVPLVMAGVMPLTRTGAWPMIGFPPILRRPGYNRLTYRIAEQLVWHVYRSSVRRGRKEILELDPGSFWGHFEELERRAIPMLYGYSTHVVPRPDDWGAHVHVTGYWFPEDDNWRPPPDLLRFLDAGSPPVFLGFGSMPVRNPQQTTQLLLDAVQQSGRRAILHAGWAGIGAQDLPDTVFPIEYAPYDWLFPRLAAIVHHGGSGTTGAALRAGKPSILVPFLFDQFFWGEHVARLGVGPAPLPFKELSAERLAGAIHQAVTDREMQYRAAALSEQIRAEEGIDRAVEWIVQYGTTRTH
jgi:UDP:flavonoid glycosyltransferase YjiC (YdhE family)